MSVPYSLIAQLEIWFFGNFTRSLSAAAELVGPNLGKPTPNIYDRIIYDRSIYHRLDRSGEPMYPDLHDKSK